MRTENNFLFTSRQIIASVDFLKWTSTFGEGSIRQIETPVRGVQFSPALTDLFGFARDDLGLMLAMDAREGAWLEHLPVAAALHGYDGRSSLLLMTGETEVMDMTLPPTGIEIYVPLQREKELTGETLLGFCLVQKGTPKRVGRMVRLYTPATWEDHRAQSASRPGARNSGSFFS
jgi:hypothetical protein